MDSRAKQRLTGAIILAALFVLLVPELLTGPKPTSAPAAPVEEEGLRSYTIEIDGKNPPGAPAAAERESATSPATNPAPTPSVAPSGASGATSPPSVAASTATPPAETDAAPAEPGAATPDSPRSAPPVAANTPAPAPVAPAPAQPAQVPRGSFVVQLGSFGSRDNADRLVRDMSAKGFKAFVAPIRSGGRELYRVRVGPTRDRASAEALAIDLKRVGQSGSIVPIS